jgi:predicted Fe-Mo cluster-binding NifX family protein
MRAAITSTGNSLKSTLDERFGRCAWFVIYDTDSGSVEFIPNAAANADEGAGLAAVETIAGKKAEMIISGEFGFKIKSVLEGLNIQMVILKQPEKTIEEIIQLINHKK